MLKMRWVDLAFLHWRVPADILRPMIPAALELDLFDGTAWVGVTPFRMTKVRPVFSPPIPTASDFPELNVRTYVRHDSHHGVWFFSLDAGSKLAVTTARTMIGLPYMHAHMQHVSAGDDVQYSSRRTHSGEPSAELKVRYRPTSPPRASEPGSLEHWLTERYCLFSQHVGTLWRLDIEHVPWPLQNATADIEINTMASAAGISLPDDAPHVRFSRSLDVVAHRPVLA